MVSIIGKYYSYGKSGGLFPKQRTQDEVRTLVLIARYREDPVVGLRYPRLAEPRYLRPDSEDFLSSALGTRT